MKTFLTAALLLLTTVLFAQPNNVPIAIEDAPMDSYLAKKMAAELKIKVINTNKPLIGTKVKYTLVHFGPEGQVTNFAQLDSNGSATIVLHENLPYQQVWLDVDGFFYTGILVNEGLEVIIDANEIKEQLYFFGPGILFKGQDAGINETLCKHMLYEKNKQEQLSSRLVEISLDAANKKMEQKDFLKSADSIYREFKKIDDAFILQNKGYGWAIRNETASDFYDFFVVGFNGSANIPDSIYQAAVNHKPYFTSNGSTGFYKNLSSFYANKKNGKHQDIQQSLYAGNAQMNHEQKTILDSITYFESHPDLNNKKTLNKLYAKRYQLFKKELDKLYLLNAMSDIEANSTGAKSDILKISLMGRWKDQFSNAYPVILNSMNTQWTKQYVQTKLDEATANKKEIDRLFQSSSKQEIGNYFIGKPIADLPFGAQLYKLDSINNIDDFILNLKSKFKNKALVIDIWATWCGPCIADITNSKELHEESKGLPIEYIYLCTTSSSDEETWKKRIGELKPPGTHIFIDEKLESAFRKTLNAEGGYPTYVVIDQKGNVSSDKIDFMSALNKDALKKKAKID